MADPVISVVMKAYNHADFVGQAIESILSQTFSDFELIIVDDASTDGTADVAAGYSDPRIRLRRLARNGGISNAMNTAISLAKGEFLATQNSDDFSLFGRLGKQLTYLHDHPEALAVFCQPLQVDESGRRIEGVEALDAMRTISDFSREAWLRRFFFQGNCIAPTGMVRRSAYPAAGPYDPRLTNLQDLDMWVRVAMAGELHVTADALAAFRVWRKQTSAPTSETSVRSQYEYFRILERYLDLDQDFLARIFAADIASLGLAEIADPKHLVARLALAADQPPHRLLGIKTLFDLAKTEADYRELRELSGRTDIFGIRPA